jgi:hypothetical protein
MLYLVCKFVPTGMMKVVAALVKRGKTYEVVAAAVTLVEFHIVPQF